MESACSFRARKRGPRAPELWRDAFSSKRNKFKAIASWYTASSLMISCSGAKRNLSKVHISHVLHTGSHHRRFLSLEPIFLFLFHLRFLRGQQFTLSTLLFCPPKSGVSLSPLSFSIFVHALAAGINSEFKLQAAKHNLFQVVVEAYESTLILIVPVGELAKANRTNCRSL